MTTEPPLDSRRARLEMNARAHRHDPQMEAAERLWTEDRDRFDRLPAQIKSQLGVYLDLRDAYRRAVEAGAVPDDRGGDAADGSTS